MSRSIRLPGVPGWRLTAVLAAGLVGWAVYGTQKASIPHLDDQAVSLTLQHTDFPQSRLVENSWIEKALPIQAVSAPELTLTPPPGPPCPTDVDRVPSRVEETTAQAQRVGTARALSAAVRETDGHWLPTLAYTAWLFEQGQTADAERELEQLTRNSAFVQLMRNLRSRGIEEYLAEIHVLHALSFSRLRNRSHEGEDVLGDLRRAIRRADYLGKKGKTNRALGDPNWYNHQLRRPGCSWGSGRFLSTFDLYNNLLQLYLVSDYQEEDQKVRDREFTRDYQDAPAKNPMQRVVERAVKNKLVDDEAWVWAASNVERLARNRREAGLGPPEHPQLALTMARVMAEGAPLLSSRAAKETLWQEVAVHAEIAEASDFRQQLAPALVRLELLSRVAGFPFETKVDVPEAQPVSAAVSQAVVVRSDPERLKSVLQGETQKLDALKPVGGTTTWPQALRLDAAAALTRAGLQAGSPIGRADLLHLIKGLVGNSEPPAEVAELRATFGPQDHLRLILLGPLARWALAVSAGLVTFIFFWWLALQALMHKHLFTSFYRLEAEARLRGRR